MSGNPFRRQPSYEERQYSEHYESTKAFEDAIRSAFQSSGRKTSTTKKTVRIQTPPPLSPDPTSPEEGSPLIGRVSNEGHTGSPPPLSPVDGALATSTGQTEQPGKRLGDEIAFQDDEVIDNTRRNSDQMVMPSYLPVLSPPLKITNPFQRTLATMEPNGMTAETADGCIGDPTGHGEGAGAGTAQSGSTLDVDAFSRMLMTGQGPAPPTQKRMSADGSILQASTRTPSTDTVPRPKAIRPPPPKHRHGTFVNDEDPRTELLDASDTRSSRGKVKQNSQSSSFHGQPRQSSHSLLFPPGPRDSSQSTDGGVSRSGKGDAARRAAPPIPLARRTTSPHEPHRTETNDSSPIPTLPNLAKDTQNHQQSKSSKAPRPPPARRVASRISLPPDAAFPTSEQTSMRDDYGFSDSTSAKRSLNAMPGSSPSSSISERAIPPPPPPTRRRRGSSKSSMEPPPISRTPSDAKHSSDEFNKRGSAEIPQRGSSLSQVSEDGHNAGQPQANVLDDLSQLQAEVEALRKQYEGDQ